MIAAEHPAKLLKVLRCVNLSCEADADVVVAPLIALCGTHALEWYLAERVTA